MYRLILDEVKRGRRRMAPNEYVDLMRKELGVDAVGGIAHPVDVGTAEQYSGVTAVYSFSRISRAYIVRGSTGSSFKWRTFPLPKSFAQRGCVLVFPLAMGNGSPYPQPSGLFELRANGRSVASLCLTKRSRFWAGPNGTLYFDVRFRRNSPPGGSLSLDERVVQESTFTDGYAFLRLDPGILQSGNSVELEIVGRGDLPSTQWIRIGQRTQPGEPAAQPFYAEWVDEGIRTLLKGPRHSRIGKWSVLFGDLHNHSGQTENVSIAACGAGQRNELFKYGRDVSGLDFFCLSEHDWQMDERGWSELDELNEAFNDPGRFVTIPGFEWTSSSYGHRNVYYRERGEPFITSKESSEHFNRISPGAPTPEDLWSFLRERRSPSLTVPHHTSLVQFPVVLSEFYEERYDRVAEIYSCWGDSLEHTESMTELAERYPDLALINAVRAGYRIGFLASSDSHDGHPGNAQGTPRRNQLFHHLGSGVVGVLAEELERGSVFDAIAQRRCYASTDGGTSLGVFFEGYPMGAEIAARDVSDRPVLTIEAQSDGDLQEAIIYKGGAACEVIPLAGASDSATWEDADYRRGADANYFVKVVRADQEVAWSSPVWVDAG